jgi:hypothetical protein
MKLSYTKSIIAPFVVGLFISGCSIYGTHETNSVPTSEYIVPSSQVTESIKLTLTETLDTTKTEAVISAQDKQRLLTQFLETNGGCQLPCYWGIIPGETSWDYTLQFLSSIGNVVGPGGKGKVASYGLRLNDIGGDLGEMKPGFWVRDGVVVAIMINSHWIRKDFDFSLAGLLVEFGLPEEIWLRPTTDTPGQPYYELALWYPSTGIVVKMQGYATKNDYYLSICPQDIYSYLATPPWLYLWNPNEQVDFKYFGLELLDDDLGWLTKDYKPLSELSVDKLTNTDFYELYKSTDAETCVNVIPVY